MALSSFLTVNGYNFPTPRRGFQYIISTTVNDARNANNAFIGTKVGRDLFKLDEMEWVGLDASVWQKMLAAVEPFVVPVTFEDYRTGQPITIKMYPGDRTAVPLRVGSNHIITKYETCSFNLVDAGLE